MESCFPPLAALSLRGSISGKKPKNRHSLGSQPFDDGDRYQLAPPPASVASNANPFGCGQLQHSRSSFDNRQSTQCNDNRRPQHHREFLSKLEVLQDLDLYYIRQMASSLKVRNLSVCLCIFRIFGLLGHRKSCGESRENMRTLMWLEHHATDLANAGNSMFVCVSVHVTRPNIDAMTALFCVYSALDQFKMLCTYFFFSIERTHMAVDSLYALTVNVVPYELLADLCCWHGLIFPTFCVATIAEMSVVIEWLDNNIDCSPFFLLFLKLEEFIRVHWTSEIKPIKYKSLVGNDAYP